MVFEDMISVPGIPSHLNYQAGYKKGYTTGFKVRASVLAGVRTRPPWCVSSSSLEPAFTFVILLLVADIVGLQGGIRRGYPAG